MTEPRALPTVSLTSPAPLIAAGRPVRPRFTGQLANTATLLTGPGHFRAEKPRTKRAPGAGAGSTVTVPWTYRWSVETLPDPASHGGFYWLGTPSGADGTSGIQAAARQWAADGTGPDWHSQFPFKPSVVAVDHYLFGGELVHHPRGVSLNSHFIEHMWLDMGKAIRQPFTWVIAACVTNWDFKGQRHYLLDAGRSPAALGVGGYRIADCMTPRVVDEKLDYRSLIGINRDLLITRSRTGTRQAGRLNIAATLRPKMYVATFNGASSALGVFTPQARRLRGAHLDSGGDHRYYLLGRRANVLSQRQSGSVIVFEMRFFNKVLDRAELTRHYRELAADYHFAKYQRG